MHCLGWTFNPAGILLVSSSDHVCKPRFATELVCLSLIVAQLTYAYFDSRHH